MKRHFFIDKMATIYRGLEANTGFSPVAELNYGKGVSRILLTINMDEIRNFISDECLNLDKAEFRLKMKNCASINLNTFKETLAGPYCSEKERTSSFDLILFKLPRNFDSGMGSSLSEDVWTDSQISYSENGCNWYQSENGYRWKVEEQHEDLFPGRDDGVYDNEFLNKEYEKYLNGEESIVKFSQHFNIGNENIDFDVTSEIINLYNSDEDNTSYGIAFAPKLEKMETELMQYVGFFTDRTNTIYHPYIEVSYHNVISDNRSNFNPNKENKLYLYCSENGPVNLDNIPVCTIDGNKYEVKQAEKGVYYALIPPKSIDGDSYTMQYDIWSNLALNGVEIDDVEMSFVLMPNSGINLGSSMKRSDNYEPGVFTLKDNETLLIGEIREVCIDFCKEFSDSERRAWPDCEYRIYCKEGKDEIDVYEFSPCNVKLGYDSFTLFTDGMIPGKYFVDIKMKINNDIKVFKDIVHFKIANNTTDARI